MERRSGTSKKFIKFISTIKNPPTWTAKFRVDMDVKERPAPASLDDELRECGVFCHCEMRSGEAVYLRICYGSAGSP